MIVSVVLGLAAYLSNSGAIPLFGTKRGGGGSVASEEKKVQLKFMNWDSAEKSSRENLERALKEFSKKHPDIEVVKITVPFTEYQEQLIRQTSNGDDPDVIQLNGNWPVLLAKRGVLQEMDGYPEEQKINPDFYSAETVETCKYNGKLYSIPYCMNAYGLWYNKNLLKRAGIQEPPHTIEELTEQLGVIRRELPFIEKPKPMDVYGIGLDLTRTAYAFEANWPLFKSFGVTVPLGEFASTTVNNERFLNALKWYKMLIDRKYSPDGVRTNVLREMMANEQIVFKVDNPGLKGVIQNINPGFGGNLFDRTFGVVPLPAAEKLRTDSTVDAYSLGISSRSRNKDAAWKFVRFILEDEASVRNYLIPSGYIPSMRSVINNNAVELNSASTHVFLNDIIPGSKHMVYTPRYSETSMIILDGMQKIFAGSDINATFKEMDSLLNELSDEK